MKLLRLKIIDLEGFRSLPCGFEHYFRSEWSLQDELTKDEGFAPFVCAGLNGSGKSNLLEVLAAIFFQLEILRVGSSFLPEQLQDDDLGFAPAAFELEYLIRAPAEYRRVDGEQWAKVSVKKSSGEPLQLKWSNQTEFDWDADSVSQRQQADILLPEYVLAYSSGENEILSLPFFKMRFVQYDEYWHALNRQTSYAGHPETRLAFLDSEFSQAILLCNLLFQDKETLKPFREDVGIEALLEFRIVIRRSIPLSGKQLLEFASEDQNSRQTDSDIVESNSALSIEETDVSEFPRYRLNLIRLLEGDEKSSRAVSALKRCATLLFEDEAEDTLTLDFRVDESTKQAFRENFSASPLELFQNFQVLLMLNLYTVDEELKADLYRSSSHYASETVPTLASDQRIMRFKNFYFSKQGVEQPMLLKELSDGEHQLLHSLGMCLLFRESNSLFLLDEPETHFNPDWRANFITRLRQCLPDNKQVGHEMLITTHTPFLISDSKPDKVLVFSKDSHNGTVSISSPDYNTLGASINKITMKTFGKRETIGGYAHSLLQGFRDRFEQGDEDKEKLIDEIHEQLGDSVEKILLIKAILGSDQQGERGMQD